MAKIINWPEIFKRETAPPEEHARERLVAGYRLTREVARVKGLVAPQELLCDSEVVQMSWHSPITCLECHPVGNPVIRRREISLQPPPQKDWTQFSHWLDAFGIAEQLLGFQRSISSQRGIFRLIHPSYSHQYFPEPDEIMAYERMLIYESLNTQITTGILESISRLKDKHGFTTREAEQVSTLARSYAPRLTESDIEEQRALMVLRIEKLVQDFDDAGDSRGKLSAFKLLTFVQQLHQVGKDNTLQKMIQVVATTSQKVSELKQPAQIPLQGDGNEEIERIESE